MIINDKISKILTLVDKYIHNYYKYIHIMVLINYIMNKNYF
jgi:hypothetical protein